MNSHPNRKERTPGGSKQDPNGEHQCATCNECLCHLVVLIATHCSGGNHLSQDYRLNMHSTEFHSSCYLMWSFHIYVYMHTTIQKEYTRLVMTLSYYYPQALPSLPQCAYVTVYYHFPNAYAIFSLLTLVCGSP